MKKMLDLKELIDWLGAEGARSGLRNSKRLTLNELRQIAEYHNVSYKSKITRNQLIDLMILEYDKRIDKKIAELETMDSADLAEYLDRTGCSKEEIVNLLIKNEIPFKRSDSRASLIKHAADQISGLGVFRRIAHHSSEKDN